MMSPHGSCGFRLYKLAFSGAYRIDKLKFLVKLFTKSLRAWASAAAGIHAARCDQRSQEPRARIYASGRGRSPIVALSLKNRRKGRKNSPVDCFSVGKPVTRGFPDAAQRHSCFNVLLFVLYHKTEIVRRTVLGGAEAMQAIFEYIELFYNCKRIHSCKDYLPTYDYESSRNSA